MFPLHIILHPRWVLRGAEVEETDDAPMRTQTTTTRVAAQVAGDLLGETGETGGLDERSRRLTMTMATARVTASGRGETAPVIEVQDLARRFGETQAVNRVTFQVYEGEIFGFLGPNGAGKTTTISMLSTLLRPTGGSARINGFDVVRQRSDVRRSIGLVFQQSTLDDTLTAEQNLRFHAYAYGVPADLREQRIRELLTLVELWDRRRGRDGRVRTFSGGMKRRLEIARGLLHRPRVLFLDEPTLGLDPQTRRRIWDYLVELRARERLTIFLTTHYLDEAEHCDRIAIIDHGEIVALDTPDRLKRAVGGDLITLTLTTAANSEAAASALRQRFGVAAIAADGADAAGTLSFRVPAGDAFLPEFIRSFGYPLEAISVRRPTLDDVFLHLTGRQIREGESGAESH
jgi:ABC-2 type transport system ATP-binding protein